MKGMRDGNTKRTLVLAIGLLMMAPGAARAGSADATTKCDAAKTKLAGEYVACVQKAEAKRILTGRFNPSACDALKLLERWRAIQDRANGACAVTDRDFGLLITETPAFSSKMSLAIHPPTKLFLFDGGVSATGDFDGGVCAQALDETSKCGPVAELVSLQFTPLYFRPPGNLPIPDLPIYSRTGVKIADGWEDFTDGDFDACLQTSPGPDCDVAAGILPDGDVWWHGSAFDGFGETSDNCNDFLSTADLFRGNVGISSGDGLAGHASPWGNLAAKCDGSDLPAPAHVLCLCYER
jgi:hypothetical protein